MIGIDSLIKGVANIADKYFTNKGDKERFISELKSQELDLKKLVITEEGKIERTKLSMVGKLIEKGCIPAIFWLFILVEATNCLIMPCVAYFTGTVFPVVHLSPEYYSLLKVVVASLFAKKGAEKIISGKT